MARLIDADILKNRLDDMEVRGGHKYYREGMDVALHEFMPALIDEQPTVDAVPVVRCVNCIHFGAEAAAFDAWTPMCMRHKIPMFPRDYCCYGERRSDG